VLCSHGGQARPKAPSMRVKVDGQPIVTQLPPYVVVGCRQPPPPAANGPCITAQWTTGTGATHVTSQGSPVLLQDSQATCAPAGTLHVKQTQVRVKGT
jgi:hypothetical protein